MGKIEELETSPEVALPDRALAEPDLVPSNRSRSFAAEISTASDAAVPRTGAVALMTAVLEEAIRSCFSHTPQIRADAEAWLTSGQRRSIFSYLVICETLGLDPQATRRAILRLVGTGTSRKSVRRTRTHIRNPILTSAASVSRRGTNRVRR
jgi:hypothetical protein